MVTHPLFRTLATQPGLLAEHAGAYAELAAFELGDAAARLRARALLGGAALACGALGLGLAGVSALLLAAVPLAQMPAAWALAAVPGAPLLAALGLWLAQRRQASGLGFDLLRAQLAEDAALWRQVTVRASA